MTAPEIDLDGLEALAKAATPGPWEAPATGHHVFGSTPAHAPSSVANTGWGERHLARPNAAYIAAVDPPTVVALIERLRAAEERIDDLRDRLAAEVRRADEWEDNGIRFEYGCQDCDDRGVHRNEGEK